MTAGNRRMDEAKRLYYLQQMGIQAWLPRTPAGDTAGTVETSREDTNRDDRDILKRDDRAGDEHVIHNLDELEQIVAACTLCDLHKTRTQTVFGVGAQNADWLIIGEAPGAEEDRKGEPFVGRAGQLLNNMLRAIGLAREEVYIANILKCRPPQNRDPQADEINSCRPYLRRQIGFIQPKIILAMGRVAAQSLLETDIPIGRMRGRKYSYEDTGIPIVATYHPAYLLRSPQQKRKAWEDLKFAVEVRKSSA